MADTPRRAWPRPVAPPPPTPVCVIMTPPNAGARIYGFDVFFGSIPALKLTVLLAGLAAYCGAWLAR